jgi:transcriptional regulator with XRE-family HTH domain
MRLRQWLKREERTAGWLARRLGVTRSAANNWAGGFCMPSASNCARIAELTGDEVRARDFAEHVQSRKAKSSGGPSSSTQATPTNHG